MCSRVLAVIPARGGSKGLPRKNLRPIAGKPLISWTIEAALGSQLLGRVLVSTEDAEIAEVARAYGDILPFVRPVELAGDKVSAIEPVIHALQWLEKNENYEVEYVILLQPTSPLRTTEDIDNAIRLCILNEAESTISVCEAHNHPYFIMKLDGHHSLSNFVGMSFDEQQSRFPQRQDLPPAYVENGAVFMARPSVLLSKHSFYGREVFGYLMPQERSLDIDSLLDFRLAEMLLEDRLLKGKRHGGDSSSK